MRFEDGQDNIQEIYFADDSTIKIGEFADVIKVVMENGQMSEVPWFEVYKNGKLRTKWNAALIHGVRLS